VKRLRILVLMHDYLVPPEEVSPEILEDAEWRTEYDVLTALRKMGHEPRPLGVKDDMDVVRAAHVDWKPHLAFNMMENFREIGAFDQHVVSYLEVLGLPYTGCNPRGLMLSRDKGISKSLMAYHRIPLAAFKVYRIGQRIQWRKNLAFPLFVKSLTTDASIGISQASVVEDEAKLIERVLFIHKNVGTDALVERYIEGRELYVGVLGNLRVQVFPVWELKFKAMGTARPIATDRVKWSRKYQEKHEIESGQATGLSEELTKRIQRLCKRVYKTLELSGYARIDLRLTPEGRLYVMEANANPHIARDEDFAESAKKAGVRYEALLQKILDGALRWRPERG
jgi:D-alanine-D-alanine ligase